jgi:hypothetical protein
MKREFSPQRHKASGPGEFIRKAGKKENDQLKSKWFVTLCLCGIKKIYEISLY